MPINNKKTQRLFDSVTKSLLRQPSTGIKTNPETGLKYEEPLQDKHPGLDIALMAAQPGNVIVKALAPSVYKGIVQTLFNTEQPDVIGGAGILDLLSPESAANLLKASGEAAKTAAKVKRPRIVPSQPKTYEKVNYVPRPRQAPVVEEPNRLQDANRLMNDLDKYIETYGVSPETYPSSVRRAVFGSVKNGTYGPSPKGIQRTISEEVVNTPDFFRLGPHSSAFKIDQDLRNATTAYDVIGVNAREQAPTVSEQFLGSGLQQANHLARKKIYPSSGRVTKDLAPVSKGALNEMLFEDAIGEQGAIKQGILGRPVTSIQSDMERFYRPTLEDSWGPIRSTYETTAPESFEDMYRRLTGYTGKLLDKNGGKLNGKCLK